MISQGSIEQMKALNAESIAKENPNHLDWITALKSGQIQSDGWRPDPAWAFR
ncbi:MAG TPA: hypothetical protein VMK12_20695 [Anaeromyxobacteraceae bacterium]|nr:hypothetical protein [Anaeromyxobacteraceae bacterium]